MDRARLWRFLTVLAAFLAGLALGAMLAADGRLALRGPDRGRGLDLSVRDGGRYGVVRVVDGDTVILESGLHVRYEGINAPEVYEFRVDPKPHADEATELNRALVEGQEVVLRLSPRAVDKHGRLCARVYRIGPDGREEDVSSELVRRGLAYVSYGGGRPDLSLRGAEDEARAAARGLWAPDSPVKPPSSAAAFVASRSGEAFHRPGCHHARRISPERRLEFSTREEAAAAGRRPCKTCRP